MGKYVTLLCALPLLGCGKSPSAPRPINGKPNEPLVELRLGNDQDEPRHLSFRIVATHHNQKPSKDFPYRTNGGNWTFMDCQASSDPKVVFAIGVLLKRDAGKSPISFGDAVLIVKDREAGARLLALFSNAFGGKLPTAVERDHVPKPLHVKTAVLGQNLQRETNGGFSGDNGTWTAIKWFLDLDGFSCEVFFNFDLANGLGEFSEKDPDYADDLLAVLASAFRDGPRPERTPENDPNLTRIAAKIGQPRTLLPRLSSFYKFSPAGSFAIYQDRKAIFAVAVEPR